MHTESILLAPGAARYEPLFDLASGGMGTVRVARAIDGVTGAVTVVAFKTVHARLLAAHQVLQLFMNETRLASCVRHPNVVAVLDAGTSEGAPFLALEYVAGASALELARAAAQRGGALPLGVALRICADAAAGLHAAHEARDASGRPLGIVHRDVSPHNVMVREDGVAKVTDFGIAKALDTAVRTMTGNVRGKPGYLAPEQLSGQPVDRRADVFALGIVLFELSTGRRLFTGDDPASVLRAVLIDPIPDPRAAAVRPGYPDALAAVVLRALERDPARRFGTCAELAAALEPVRRAVGDGEARDVAAALLAFVPERLASRRDQLARALAQGPAPEPRASIQSLVMALPQLTPSARTQTSFATPTLAAAAPGFVAPAAPAFVAPKPGRHGCVVVAAIVLLVVLTVGYFGLTLFFETMAPHASSASPAAESNKPPTDPPAAAPAVAANPPPDPSGAAPAFTVSASDDPGACSHHCFQLPGRGWQACMLRDCAQATGETDMSLLIGRYITDQDYDDASRMIGRYLARYPTGTNAGHWRQTELNVPPLRERAQAAGR